MRKRRDASGMGPLRLATVIACSICLVGWLMPARPVECGRLQDFIQNLVNGGSSSSSSNSNNNSNKDSSSNNNNNNNNNNNDANDSDTAASNDSNEQPLTPMMSAMNPFMRYPSFYDSFGGPAGFGGAPGAGGYPGMSAFSGPMAGAMSAMSPALAAMSSNNALAGAFSPAAFSPASFGSFGSGAGGSGNPMGAFGSAGAAGMSASTLNNVYAQSTPGNAFMGAYTPYYGRRR